MTKQSFPTTIEVNKLVDGKAHGILLWFAQPVELSNQDSVRNLFFRIECAKFEESDFKIDSYEEAVSAVLALAQNLFPTFEQPLLYDGVVFRNNQYELKISDEADYVMDDLKRQSVEDSGRGFPHVDRYFWNGASYTAFYYRLTDTKLDNVLDGPFAIVHYNGKYLVFVAPNASTYGFNFHLTPTW